MMIDTQDTVGIRQKHTKDTVSGAVPSVYYIFALEWVRQRGARTARRTRLQGCAKRSARRCPRAISAPLGAVRSSKASSRRCATAASIRASSALGDAAVSTACRGSGVGGDHEAGNSGIERLQTSARCPNGCIRPALRQSRAGSYRKVLIDLQGSHLRGTLLFCRKSNVTERRGESRLAATGRRLTARSAAAEGACQDRSIDPSHRWYAHATLDGQN